MSCEAFAVFGMLRMMMRMKEPLAVETVAPILGPEYASNVEFSHPR